jgi:hypothetical protein
MFGAALAIREKQVESAPNLGRWGKPARRSFAPGSVSSGALPANRLGCGGGQQASVHRDMTDAKVQIGFRGNSPALFLLDDGTTHGSESL